MKILKSRLLLCVLVGVLLLAFVGCAETVNNNNENNNNNNNNNIIVEEPNDEVVPEEEVPDEIIPEEEVVEVEPERVMEDLKFGDDGTFKILQLTDIHYRGNVNDPSLALMKKLIAEENPDLVVLTGDLTQISSDHRDTIEDSIRVVVAAINETGVPFAANFGNHDDDSGIDLEIFMDVLQESENCYAKSGDVDVSGVGNYTLEIKGKDSDDTKYVLYFLDTHADNQDLIVRGYDFLKRDQIDWYVETSEMYQETLDEYSALMFIHIPLYEYRTLWDWNTCYGEKNEGILSPRQNSGMFSAMVEMKDVVGLFCGHDHCNNFYGTLYGIGLYYGRVSGYSATTVVEGYLRGARVIEITEDSNKFTSWQRLEDGSVVTKQEKHFYNQDD